MNQGQGWIKLHRQIQEHWLWKNGKPFDKRSAWIDLLLLVNHDDKKVFFENEIIFVRRGEHITSETKLAERWGWSRTKVRNFLKILEKDGMIENIKEDRKRTRLRVLNYNNYQDSENNKKTSDDTTKKQEENKRRTRGEQEENINKNDKNEKNDKNYSTSTGTSTTSEQNYDASREPQNEDKNPKQKRTALIFDEDTIQFQLAMFMRQCILENLPNARVPEPTPKGLRRWAYDIDLMIRIDNRKPEEIRELIDWSHRDSFWKANILSPRKLREKWDTLVLHRQREFDARKTRDEPRRHIPRAYASLMELRKGSGET